MTTDLFADQRPARQDIAPGVVLFPGRAVARDIWPLLQPVLAVAPFRNFVTPGGRRMGVETTNCGSLGWVSDKAGYRYQATDPDSGRPWPAMPRPLFDLAVASAAAAGFPETRPDSCLINRYAVGVRLTAHQDLNEQSSDWPIVSISMGLPATFVLHGATRGGAGPKIALTDGDVLVFGGPARNAFHSVQPIADGVDPVLGPCRVNLTLRVAG